MSEAFVDVMWRGLEVGKRVKLHAIRPGDAYIDHTTPMPVGTTLALRTDEGIEIAAMVLRVHEQVGGSTEVPGMQVKPLLAAGAATDWWKAHEERPPARPETDTGPPPMSPAAVAAAASVDPRAAIVAKPTLTMSTVEVERAMAAVKGTVAEELDSGRTEVMNAVDPALLEALAVEERSDPNLVDDGKRTMQMSVADVNAIVEAAESGDMSGGIETGEEPSSDDAGASGSRPGNGNGSPSGKKKRGKRRRG